VRSAIMPTSSNSENHPASCSAMPQIRAILHIIAPRPPPVTL
jgi:hypothetical protein